MMMLADASSFFGSVWFAGLALLGGVCAGYVLRSKKQL